MNPIISESGSVISLRFHFESTAAATRMVSVTFAGKIRGYAVIIESLPTVSFGFELAFDPI